jgi:hypothetical protein
MTLYGSRATFKVIIGIDDDVTDDVIDATREIAGQMVDEYTHKSWLTITATEAVEVPAGPILVVDNLVSVTTLTRYGVEVPAVTSLAAPGTPGSAAYLALAAPREGARLELIYLVAEAVTGIWRLTPWADPILGEEVEGVLIVGVWGAAGDPPLRVVLGAEILGARLWKLRGGMYYGEEGGNRQIGRAAIPGALLDDLLRDVLGPLVQTAVPLIAEG